jgi:hypothetical protein
MAYAPFDAPIPGQSLTTEPKNVPWEQPPQMADVEDVAKFYIERLANPDVIDDFAALCEAGVSLAPIVESTYLQGVARGLHTLDAGMLVAPMIHAFLKAAITDLGVDVKDDGSDPEAEVNEKERNRFMVLAMKYMQENPDESDPGKQMLKEMVEENQEEASGTEEPNEVEGPEEEMQEDMAQEKPMGLMAKG